MENTFSKLKEKRKNRDFKGHKGLHWVNEIKIKIRNGAKPNDLQIDRMCQLI